MASPFNEQGVQYAFDNTSISWFVTCPRYYQLKMIERWEPAKLSVHLWFGQHFATALERYYKCRAEGMDLEEAMVTVVHAALIDTWIYKRDEQGNIIEPRVGAPYDSFNPAKTRESLIRTIIWYIDQFHDEDLKILMLSNGKPAVELSFKLAIDDGNYYCGHIDRIATLGDDPYLMDQKTTGSTISQSFFSAFDLNFQMSGYTFAGKALFHIPVKGVIIDGAQIAVGFTRFERGFTFRTQDQLDEWYDGLMYWIEQIQSATRKQHFPQNLTSCEKYGGCEFRNVCARSPQLRKNFLAGDFNKRPQWNPLEPR